MDYKYIRPYKITKKILENNYKLDLLLKVRLYLIFYISLLKLVVDIIQVKIRNELEEINRLELYKAKAIRDIKKENKQIMYLVK